jgi:cell division protein FtsI/penicillin-binding protein 2
MSQSGGGDEFTRRAITLSSLGGLFFAALGGRMAQLQIFENNEFRLEAAENQFNLLVSPASRGPVYDRFGVPLAVNRRDFRVSIMREDVKDLPGTINALASILRIPSERASSILSDAKTAPRFMPHPIKACGRKWAKAAIIPLAKVSPMSLVMLPKQMRATLQQTRNRATPVFASARKGSKKAKRRALRASMVPQS